MNLTESVRFVLSEEDKFLLSSIAKQEGDSSMSATIRRWIRDAAKRNNIEFAEQPTNQTAGEK